MPKLNDVLFGGFTKDLAAAYAAITERPVRPAFSCDPVYGELLIKPLQATGQIIDFVNDAYVREAW